MYRYYMYNSSCYAQPLKHPPLPSSVHHGPLSPQAAEVGVFVGLFSAAHTASEADDRRLSSDDDRVVLQMGEAWGCPD